MAKKVGKLTAFEFAQAQQNDLSDVRKAFCKEEMRSPFDMSRREIDAEKARLIFMLDPRHVKAATLLVGGENISSAMKRSNIRFPTSPHLKTIFRRYIQLALHTSNLDLQHRLEYNKIDWYHDQKEILDKALGRKEKRVMLGDTPQSVRADNLNAANKANEILGKAFGFFEDDRPKEKPEEPEEKVINPVAQVENQQINITKIEMHMDDNQATRLYRQALAHE